MATLTGHGHAHGSDDPERRIDGWDRLSNDATMRATVIGVGIAAVLTLLGVVLLWPSGEGRTDAIAAGQQLGIVAERLPATVVDEVLAEWPTCPTTRRNRPDGRTSLPRATSSASRDDRGARRP